MKSKSFISKIGYVGKKSFIIHIPVAVAKLLKLKIGQHVKVTLKKCKS